MSFTLQNIHIQIVLSPFWQNVEIFMCSPSRLDKKCWRCIIELFWIQYSRGSNRKINKRLTAQRKWTLFLAIKIQGGLRASRWKEMYNNGWGGIKQTMLQCYILHCSSVATIRSEAWTAETSFKTVLTSRNTNLSFIAPRKNWEKQV